MTIHKRLAKPGEGEIPIGGSEIPGGGPQAYTDPATGERMIDEDREQEQEVMKHDPAEEKVKRTKRRK